MKRISASHVLTLLAGIGLGVGTMALQPRPVAKAATNDRSAKFAMATCPISDLGQEECVFMLDFLTGMLVGGAIHNQTRQYSHQYYRNVAADFGIDPSTQDPEYTIVCTRSSLQGNQLAKGTIHVAEKTSGRVLAYTFQYNNRPAARPIQLELLPTFFQFRESSGG